MKCIVCKRPVTEVEFKACEMEGTNGIYCTTCLANIGNNTGLYMGPIVIGGSFTLDGPQGEGAELQGGR